MYQFINNGICSAEEIIIASRTESAIPESYSFSRLQYPNIHFQNRGVAYHYDFLAEDSEEKKQLKNAVEEYNHYLDQLDGIEGFKQFFVEHNLCVSKEEIAEYWSEEIAEVVFSQKTYVFYTDLRLLGGLLFDRSVPHQYSAHIEGEELLLPIGEPAWKYPDHVGEMRLIWNWVDNAHDLTISIWELLGGPEWKREENPPVLYGFDYYDQIRNEEPEMQLVRVYNKLENLGYIRTVTIVPDNPNLLWKNYCKSDGSLDCGIVDMSFLKNKLVMEQINQLLWTPTDELKEKPFFLTTEMNTQRLSAVPGAFGGHKKLKIYGRLDCPSAARYLAKGQYAKQRVFFIDEETAISAGYRPCGVCMREAYAKWKMQNKE